MIRRMKRAAKRRAKRCPMTRKPHIVLGRGRLYINGVAIGIAKRFMLRGAPVTISGIEFDPNILSWPTVAGTFTLAPSAS